MLVLHAPIAIVGAGCIVDMALTWIWARGAGVVIGNVVSAAPAVVPIFVVFDGVRVSRFCVEPVLLCWLLGVVRAGRAHPLLLLCLVVALLLGTAPAWAIVASAAAGASESTIFVVLVGWCCLSVLLLLHLCKNRFVIHGRL